MLNVLRLPTNSFWACGLDNTTSESWPTSNTGSSHDAIQGADSWVIIDEVPASSHSNPVLADPRNSRLDSSANLVRDTGTGSSGTTLITDPHVLDAVTFPPYATHILPSESNGTWRPQVGHAVINPVETASLIREALKQHAHDLDSCTLLHKLEQIAEDRKDGFNGWLNHAFADYDLVEMHHRVRRLVPVISMPNMRQIDHAVDTVADIAQSLPKRRSEPDLLENIQVDKYTFARAVGQKARSALIEQGICKEWQFMSEEHAKAQLSMQSALIRTFLRIRQLHQHVPLAQAKPQWIADREQKVWRLELDVGVLGVEVGPASDRALVELGFIDTGFILQETHGCVSIADLDRQAQNVGDDWELLEG